MKMFMDFVEIEVPDETILWKDGRMVDGEGRIISTEQDNNGSPEQIPERTTTQEK